MNRFVYHIRVPFENSQTLPLSFSVIASAKELVFGDTDRLLVRNDNLKPGSLVLPWLKTHILNLGENGRLIITFAFSVATFSTIPDLS